MAQCPRRLSRGAGQASSWLSKTPHRRPCPYRCRRAIDLSRVPAAADGRSTRGLPIRARGFRFQNREARQRRLLLQGAYYQLFPWARLGLNQRPLACEASALPLSYAPGASRFYAVAGSTQVGPGTTRGRRAAHSLRRLLAPTRVVPPALISGQRERSPFRGRGARAHGAGLDPAVAGTSWSRRRGPWRRLRSAGGA